MSIICEIICSPVGELTSVSEYVKAAIDAIREFKEVEVMTHPMGTVYEVDNLDKAFEIARSAHEAILMKGAKRVVTQLRIDDRRDKERTMNDKVKAVT